MDKKLQYALIISFILNSSLVLTSFYEWSFDSYTHMFFADHYKRFWFNSWEPKWFGGFSVSSYPPLVHQVIALLSYIIGLQWAYILITLCLSVIFPLAIYKFSGVLVSDEGAGYASLISVFLPSVIVITYNFGQLPTLFSLVAVLIMVYYLNRYLNNGTKFDFLLASCLLGVSICTHHFTTIFFLPLSILVLVITLVQREINVKTLAKRLLQFIIVAIIVSVVFLSPLLFSMNIDMQPIPHVTRTNLFLNPVATEFLFLGMYGPLLFFIPFVGFFVCYHKKFIPLFVVAILLFFLGLGGTTFLPKIIFGDLWLVLTYDRFALWAGVIFLPLFGLIFSHYFKGLKRIRYKKTIFIFLFITLVLSASYFGNKKLLSDSNVNIEPLQEFLGKNQNSRWRYLTLGFGDAKMQKLSVFTNASTIDGYYFLGRTIPILANSGIGTLDSAKFYGEAGMLVLHTILAGAGDYNLRWVFCNDPAYYNLLIENHFILRYSQDIALDGRFQGVSIWEKEGIPPIDVGEHVNQSTLFDFVGGIAPLSFLVASFTLFVSAILLKKDVL